MKKILYVSRGVFPSKISHTLSIMRVCQAFANEGHEVILSGRAPSKNAPDPLSYYGLEGGFKIVNVYLNRIISNKRTQKFFLDGLFLAVKNYLIVKRFKPDLVYSRLTLLALLLIPRNLPIVYEMHSPGHLEKRRYQKYIFKWLIKFKNFRRIIVTNNMLADYLHEKLPGIEIVLARLTAEEPIDITDGEIQSFRDKNFQGKDFDKHIGYTGYIDKGLRGTKYICLTAAQMPDVAFHVVGGESSIVDYFRDFSKEINSHENIFFYGYRNPEEIPYFLRLFDVVLAPLQLRKRNTLYRGMSPLKIPQYMGFGKPIVASDIPAHREILKDGENARLVTADAVQEWVSGIRELLDKPDLRYRIGNRAKEDYYENLTPGQRIEKILKDI